MERFSRSLPRLRTLIFALTAAVFAFAGARAQAQFTLPAQPQGTQVHDASALKPPAGVRVAIVEFADLECPECGHSNPVLKEAATKYKIPLVRHDFPLQMHAWSFQAAVNARWFDQKSKALGEQYRDEVFANQPSFGNNPELVARFTQKFAKSHGIDFPFAVDPQGKLAALVKADLSIGQKIGIDHTPTVWVVTSGSKGAPFIEVTDRSRLFQIIDQALADTAGPARKSARK